MMMQIFVKTLETKTIVVSVDVDGTVGDLTVKIHEKTGIPVDQQNLAFASKPLNHGRPLADYCIVNGSSTVDLVGGLKGGGYWSGYRILRVFEPALFALVMKHRTEKKVCMKCYARLPPRAHNCRKKKCGHSNQLRDKRPLWR